MFSSIITLIFIVLVFVKLHIFAVNAYRDATNLVMVNIMKKLRRDLFAIATTFP